MSQKNAYYAQVEALILVKNKFQRKLTIYKHIPRIQTIIKHILMLHHPQPNITNITIHEPKNLQHVEARVTFSLGLQPTSEHEYKLWHARRMAFKQCSLTGTALSWYIRLNDTYKHDWHAFVQAFKKQFSSQKNAYYAQVEALNLTKKDSETVRQFALKFNICKKAGAMRMRPLLTSNVMKFLQKDFPKTLNILQTKDK